MKPSLVLLALFGLAQISMASAEDGYIEVGSIPAKCPITITVSNSFAMPATWKISPLDAVARASKEGLVRCNSPFLQAVFADSTNYYIVKPAFGPISRDTQAVVINGQTGTVSVRGQNGT